MSRIVLITPFGECSTVYNAGCCKYAGSAVKGLVLAPLLVKNLSGQATDESATAGERMAVGTDAGELFIVDGSDLKSTVQSACPGEAVESITPHGKV